MAKKRCRIKNHCRRKSTANLRRLWFAALAVNPRRELQICFPHRIRKRINWTLTLQTEAGYELLKGLTGGRKIPLLLSAVAP